MPESLLRTKLFVPPLRPNSVSRPHLIQRLNQGLHLGHRLTLISAPAGFGKTTLLSEWVSQRDTATAWISLEESDNDRIRFLLYFTEALQTIDQTIGNGVLAALQTPQPPTTEALLTTLLNQISATVDDTSGESGFTQSGRADDRFVLVLDDYHVITAQPIHTALTFLLDHLPANMQLIIATRSDPPLPMTRLRGRGMLTELRETDLRFSHAETAQFINKAMALDLSEDDLSALNARTEGWIAGLQMAAVSMQSRRRYDDNIKSNSDFIDNFSGSNRHILDYLVEEVLNSQPEAIRIFLLHTSILNRLTAPLCDAILAGVESDAKDDDDPFFGPSQHTLEYLERANLFIIPLDDGRQWYRYHHLFADLLRNHLNKEHPNLRFKLHHIASLWFENEELIPEAMHHAIEGGDSDRAADLLESIVSPLLNEGQPATLITLMERLPKEAIDTRPWLAVHGAWAYFMTWQFDKIEPLLQSVEMKLSAMEGDQQPGLSDVASQIHVRLIALRAFMAQWQGDLAAATTLSQKAIAAMKEDDLQLRSVVEANLGDICLLRGDLTAARRHGENSFSSGKAAGNFYSALSAICRLAELDMIQGRLHQALKTFQKAVQQGIEWGGGQPMPGTGRAYVGLAKVFYEWNDLDQAERHLTRGIRLGEESGAQEIVLEGTIMLARLRQAQGEVEAPFEALDKAEAIAATDTRILPASHVSSWQTRIFIAQGKRSAVMRWVDSLEISHDSPAFADYRFEESYVTLVRAWLMQGQEEKASSLLNSLLAAAETEGRLGLVIEIQMLKALALFAGDDVTQAMAPLEQALALAEPQGYVRIFVDEGQPFAKLLYQAVEQGIAPFYAGELLAAIDTNDYLESKSLVQPALVEPLSKRELQVLQLIAEGLSNREIAARLVLSLNTVKGHTRKIYGKLGVNSRTQAVAKAKALGIRFPG